jgi:hypothetical protein
MPQQRTKAKPKPPGSPHKRIRPTCRWCRRSRHTRTPSGNAHRFHKTKDNPNPFCATHKTTLTGRRYCTRRGLPRKKPLKANA